MLNQVYLPKPWALFLVLEVAHGGDKGLDMPFGRFGAACPLDTPFFFSQDAVNGGGACPAQLKADSV
jgi:hypothetical protein